MIAESNKTGDTSLRNTFFYYTGNGNDVIIGDPDPKSQYPAHIVNKELANHLQPKSQSGQGSPYVPTLPKTPQNIGNNSFYRSWNVQYITQSEYSGALTIQKVNGKTQVYGNFLKAGSPSQNYFSTQVQFPNPNTMVLNYKTEKGNIGVITYTLNANGQSASGKYDKNRYSLLTPQG